MRYFLLFVGMLGINDLLASSCQVGNLPSRGKPLASKSPAKQYRLCCGLRATVRSHEVVITNAQGAVIARNSRLIRLAEDARDCPLDGFYAIAVKGNYFTLEQQNCAGWFFINEYITFRYVPGTGQIQLHKFGQSFTDRREPNKTIPDKVITSKEFGQRYFSQVALDALESLND
jgi:hypothetical protein